MADIPKFGYPRRIDIVDAVNELGGAVEAALSEGGGGGEGSYTLPVAGDSTLGGVKGQRVAEKDGNGRIINVTPDGTAFIDAADALNPGVVRSKEGNAFADTDANVAVNAHGYMKCDAGKAYVDAQVAGVEAHLEAFEAEAVTQAEGTAPLTLTVSPVADSGSKLTGNLSLTDFFSITSGGKLGVSAKVFSTYTTNATALCYVNQSNGVITFSYNNATGFAIDPKGGILAVDSRDDGIGLTFKLNVGNGLALNPNTGMLELPIDATAGLGYGSNGLEVEVDGTTIAHNSSGQLHVVDADAENVAVSSQPSSGTVSALAHGKTVCVSFSGVLVSGNSRVKVGNLGASYAPRTEKTGTVAAVGTDAVYTAYCKVDADGSIYINPVMPSGADLAWNGSFTYLI